MKNWCGEELSDEMLQELKDEKKEYWDNQDHPEQEAGERLQDTLDMYRREH